MAFCASESYRIEAPGDFVTLPNGRVHYRLFGLENPPSDKPLIVCVHGISAELAIWTHFVELMVSHGRKVLTLDLFGRGYSDGVDAPNNVELFLGQLNGLLDSSEVKSKVSTDIIDIVGSSLGGAIAAVFTARYSSRVRRCVLMAPTGLGLPNFGHALQAMCRVPFLGKALINLANRMRGMETNMLQSFSHPDDPEVQAFVKKASARAAYIAEHHPGYLPSFVSTVGHFQLDSLHADYRTLGASTIPILAVWGDKDAVVSYARDAPTFRTLVPNADFYVLQDGGHVDHFVYEPFMGLMHSKVLEFLSE